MLQFSVPSSQTSSMDIDVRTRDLINRTEQFRNRKLRQVRKRLDFGGTSGDNSPHSLAATMDPNMEELNSQRAKDLQDKYNFDFVEEEKKPGPLEWKKIVEGSSQGQEVPDFYFRAPHKKKVRRISPEILENSRASPKDTSSQDLHALGKESSSSNGSNSIRLSSTTPVTRQLFYEGKDAGNDVITSIARIAPQNASSSSSCHGNDRGNGYTSFITGTQDDLTTFTDSILGVSGGDTQRGDAIMHEPIALYGSSYGDSVTGGSSITNDVTTDIASSARFNTQGNDNNNHSGMVSPNSSRQEDTLVSRVMSGSPVIPGSKTPPHPGTSSISSEVSVVESYQQRDETPSTSGLGNRKRAGSDMTDFFPEKKRNIDRVKRKVFEED